MIDLVRIAHVDKTPLLYWHNESFALVRILIQLRSKTLIKIINYSHLQTTFHLCPVYICRSLRFRRITSADQSCHSRHQRQTALPTVDDQMIVLLINSNRRRLEFRCIAEHPFGFFHPSIFLFVNKRYRMEWQRIKRVQQSSSFNVKENHTVEERCATGRLVDHSTDFTMEVSLLGGWAPWDDGDRTRYKRKSIRYCSSAET